MQAGGTSCLQKLFNHLCEAPLPCSCHHSGSGLALCWSRQPFVPLSAFQTRSSQGFMISFWHVPRSHFTNPDVDTVTRSSAMSTGWRPACCFLYLSHIATDTLEIMLGFVPCSAIYPTELPMASESMVSSTIDHRSSIIDHQASIIDHRSSSGRKGASSLNQPLSALREGGRGRQLFRLGFSQPGPFKWRLRRPKSHLKLPAPSQT